MIITSRIQFFVEY
jgi:hypothetical protein